LYVYPNSAATKSLRNSVSRHNLKVHVLKTNWLKMLAVFSLFLLQALVNCIPRINTSFYKDDQVDQVRVSLVMHNLRAHISDRRFQCDQCEKDYTSRHMLKEHIAVVHRGKCQLHYLV